MTSLQTVKALIEAGKKSYDKNSVTPHDLQIPPDRMSKEFLAYRLAVVLEDLVYAAELEKLDANK